MLCYVVVLLCCMYVCFVDVLLFSECVMLALCCVCVVVVLVCY